MSLISQEIVDGLVGTASLGPIAYGMALELSASKMFDFGLAGIVGASSALTYFFTVTHHLTGAVPVIVILLASGVLNAGLYFGVYRPLIRRSGSPMVALIASIGVLYILSYLGSIPLGYTTQSLSTGVFQGLLRIDGLVIPDFALAAAVLGLVLIGAVEVAIRFTRYGTALRAVSDNVELAETLGISQLSVVAGAFFAGGLLAAYGSYVMSALGTADAFSGQTTILLATLAVIVAGVGSRSLAILGAAIVSVVESVSVVWISPTWEETVGFAFLMIMIVLLPQGLAGAVKFPLGGPRFGRSRLGRRGLPLANQDHAEPEVV